MQEYREECNEDQHCKSHPNTGTGEIHTPFDTESFVRQYLEVIRIIVKHAITPVPIVVVMHITGLFPEPVGACRPS